MLRSHFLLKNVWVVDDNKWFCRQVAEILKGNHLVKEVTVHNKVESAVKSISYVSIFPEIILLDVYFSGSNMTGLDALPLIKKFAPKSKIIILTAFEEELNARFALKLGASGFLVKLAGGNNIVTAVKVSMLNGIFIDPSMMSKMISVPPSIDVLKSEYGLSNREKEILCNLIEGLSMRTIAERRCISYTTVNTHIKNIHNKLEVHSRSELMVKVMNDQGIKLSGLK
jgi:DNA-binding NarL/FixJ family response regulator